MTRQFSKRPTPLTTFAGLGAIGIALGSMVLGSSTPVAAQSRLIKSSVALLHSEIKQRTSPTLSGTQLAAFRPLLRPRAFFSPSNLPTRPSLIIPVASPAKCAAHKYHGPTMIDFPYDPEKYVYTPEYERDSSRPGRAESARIAEKKFPSLVTPKVLEMLRLANEARTSRGHTAMKLEPRLTAAAKRHNIDIATHGLMQHTATDCSQLRDRVWDEGYTWTAIAENLAGSKDTALKTMAQWLGSKRHLEQMTLAGMTDVGIAYDFNPTGPRKGLPLKHYWTLILGRPDPWRDMRRFKKRKIGKKPLSRSKGKHARRTGTGADKDGNSRNRQNQ